MKHFKFIFMFMALASLGFACSSDNDNEGEDPSGGGNGTTEGDIILNISTNAIQADGKDYCEFVVKAGEADVTADADIYLVGSNTALASSRYTSSQEGSYSFFATYGDKVSAQVTISVLPEIPELPTDPQPESVSFLRRVLALQFTGTGCPNCPYMIKAIQETMKTNIAEKVLFAGIHSYNYDDIMYNKTAASIGQLYGNGYYPGVGCDMRKEVLNAVSSAALTATKLQTLINSSYDASAAKAGIAGAVTRSGNQIIVKASVKAARKGNYRINAWILENDIYAKQSNSTGMSGDFDTHNNVVRAVASSAYDFLGEDLGSIDAGASKNFVMSLATESEWNLEKCKILLFVSTPDTDTSKKFYVNNAVLCNLDQVVRFEYQ